jgi:phage-related protein
MLELFVPYMLFISFIITVLFNLWLISKKVHWIVILIANLLLILVMEFFNLAEYNFLNKVVEWIFEFVGRIFEKIFDFFGRILRRLWDSTFGRLIDAIGSLIDAIKRFFGGSSGSSGGGGGGGGFHSR